MRWKNVIIRRGRHRSMFAWKPFFGRGKIFHFTFNETAKYLLPNTNILDVNKIVGFADGCLNHHKNSFRLGWRYNSAMDAVEIFSYTYVDGERDIKHIETIGIYDTMQVEVICQKSVYRIVVNGYKVHYIKRSEKIKWRYKHLLYPYFGGQEVAPQNISIMLNWIKLPKIENK